MKIILSPKILSAFALLAILIGCAEREEILPGERIELNPSAEAQAVETEQTPATITSAVSNSSWTHRNGSAAHSIGHPALASNSPSLRWARSIGSGSKGRLRLSADPVISGGLIFAMDSQGTVSAFNSSGSPQWQRATRPASDPRDDVSGGGLAVEGNIIVASTGYGELVGISVSSGAILWRQKVTGSIGGAPVIANGQAIVVSGENIATAVNASTGRIQWTVNGGPSPTSVLGSGLPAVVGGSAILPFASGQVTSVDPASGAGQWTQVISGTRPGVARAFVGAISSGPVVKNGVLYAATQAGRMVAINSETGERIWTAREGAAGPVWPEGNSVYVVSDENKVLRLDAATGQIIWARALPRFKNVRRQKGAFAHFGPVLANGILWVASSDGELRRYDPSTGEVFESLSIPGGAGSHPAVANGVMYIVSANGNLLAFQ